MKLPQSSLECTKDTTRERKQSLVTMTHRRRWRRRRRAAKQRDTVLRTWVAARIRLLFVKCPSSSLGRLRRYNSVPLVSSSSSFYLRTQAVKYYTTLDRRHPSQRDFQHTEDALNCLLGMLFLAISKPSLFICLLLDASSNISTSCSTTYRACSRLCYSNAIL